MTALSVAADSNEFRFGTQSLKVTTGDTGDNALYPASAVTVTAGLTYTLSAYIKTAAVLASGALLRIAQAGTLTPALADSATVTDSSLSGESVNGWQRMSVSLVMPEGTLSVRPVVLYTGTTLGETFWIDGIKFEEGDFASLWHQNIVSKRLVLDQGAVQIDASQGGLLRLKGSTGGSRDTISLGTNGLVFGGDTELSAPEANKITVPRLRITATNDVDVASTEHGLQIGATSDVNLRLDNNEIQAVTNGVVSDLFIQNEGGAIRLGGAVILQHVLLSTVVGTQNDYAIDNVTRLRWGGASAVTFTGFAGWSNGRILVIHNTSTTLVMTLAHENVGSASGRIHCPGGVDLPIGPRGSVILFYDSTSARWRVASAVNGPPTVVHRSYLYAGTTSITPVASTPTSISVTGLGLSGAVVSYWATASTTVPGSVLLETSISSPTTSSISVWVYRTNTTATTVGFGVISE